MKKIDKLIAFSKIQFTKGFIMKENTHSTSLTPQQCNDRDFLYDLSNLLAGLDLSKIDLKTLPGEHHAHSALFDNYELNIARTPVMAFKNGFARFMGVGEWKYQDGVFERYEIYILQNAKNVRANDILRYAGMPLIKTHNTIFQSGTMATDYGYFAPYKHQLTNNDEEMFYRQNAHLFASAKNIYNLLDGEYNRRQSQIRDYRLSDMNGPHDLTIARNRMLDEFKKRQK